jgi:hypothetical protein
MAFLCLTVLLVSVGALRAETRPAASVAGGWHPGGGSFAIANLDGDALPDLASIEMDRANGAATSYRIRIQLSAWPESAIGIVGPLEGLRISAADVNGDDQIDLVVRTEQKSTLIAVLLNEGSGHFRVAEPASYPELEQEATNFLREKNAEISGASMALPVRGFFLEAVTQRKVAGLTLNRSSHAGSNEVCRLQEAFPPHAGRAPPIVVRSI